MFALKKNHAWLVICANLVASTAAASIPDASGVFHGCYNTLTGSVRIIEGTNCVLLEKAVTWQQTGPQGPAGNSVTGVSLNVGDPHCPAGGVALTLNGVTTNVCNGVAGPQGPQGPQGPAGPGAAVTVDHDDFLAAVPHDPDSEARTFASRSFTAAANGKCAITVSGFVGDAAAPQVQIFLTYLDNGATVTQFDARAVLNGNGGSTLQGSVGYGIDVVAGHNYTFGVDFKTFDTGVAAAALAKSSLTWVCK